MEEDVLILLGVAFNLNLPLLTAWLLDHWLGDPAWLPHPVVAFGKAISFCEHRLNRGDSCFLKGAFVAVSLVLGVYVITLLLLRLAALFSPGMLLTVQILLIFYCLAGTTLVREVRMVFKAVDRSLEEGRMQVARIVGRDTSALSAQEVRTAALETLAENLSDGVVAPLFWYLLLGVPGMLAYKMVNTLDSMVGYKNERYRRFGCFAARLDDVANYIPARLTAFLMVLVSGRLSLFAFVGRYGSQHASPNSGYPEAALAGILNCRFGGPHNYFGEEVWKPYIGSNERPLKIEDMRVAVRINRRVEWWMVVAVIVTSTLAADVESASASLAAAVPFNARFSFSAFVSFSSACTFSGVKKNPGTAAPLLTTIAAANKQLTTFFFIHFLLFNLCYGDLDIIYVFHKTPSIIIFIITPLHFSGIFYLHKI